MFFAKADLKHQYSWTAISGDNPKITGKPDSTIFNIHEGYEMLYMINHMADENNWKNKESGQKTERMLRENLPSDIRSQENVKNWLATNWNKY